MCLQSAVDRWSLKLESVSHVSDWVSDWVWDSESETSESRHERENYGEFDMKFGYQEYKMTFHKL